MDKILKDALKSQIGFPTPITVALLVAATDIITSLLLARMELGQTARVAIALLPIPANVWLIAIILRNLRRLDEFLKRIQFEAVAVAFLTTGLAALTYGQLQKAQIVGPLNVGLIWGFMGVSYALGYAVAARHYR
jgi:hypothetical protein